MNRTSIQVVYRRANLIFEVLFLIFDRIQLPIQKHLHTCLITFPRLLSGFTKIAYENQNHIWTEQLFLLSHGYPKGATGPLRHRVSVIPGPLHKNLQRKSIN